MVHHEALDAAVERLGARQIAEDRRVRDVAAHVRVASDPTVEVLVELGRFADLVVALQQRRQDFRHEVSIVVQNLLVQPDRLLVIAFGFGDRGTDQGAAQSSGFAAHRVLEMAAGELEIAADSRGFRKLAIVVRDLRRLFAGQHFELALRFNRLGPLALALVDVDELLERRFGDGRTVDQLAKVLLRAIEQAGAEIVLREREQRLMPLRVAQRRPRQQVLVDANRALHLAAPSEEMAEREVRFQRLVVDFRHLNEELERLVGTPVQDEVQAADVVGADPRRQVAIAVAVDLEEKAAGGSDDEQRGEKKGGFSWHLAWAACEGC